MLSRTPWYYCCGSERESTLALEWLMDKDPYPSGGDMLLHKI
jgi:hypothetical protein